MWEQISEISTAISVLIGSATWLTTHLWDRRRAKITHTADLISSLSTSDSLAAADFDVMSLVNAGRPVGKGDLNEIGERNVVAILNYYEYVCDACAAGVVDYRTVVNLRGKLMRRTWRTCEPYIEYLRETQRRRIYSEFEKFTSSLPTEEEYGRAATAEVIALQPTETQRLPA